MAKGHLCFALFLTLFLTTQIVSLSDLYLGFSILGLIFLAVVNVYLTEKGPSSNPE